jgi:hypothetical protein
MLLFSRSAFIAWAVLLMQIIKAVDASSSRRRAFDDDEKGLENKKLYSRMEALAGRAPSTAIAEKPKETRGEVLNDEPSTGVAWGRAEALNLKRMPDTPKYGLPETSSAAVQKLITKVPKRGPMCVCQYFKLTRP